ncbi:hypothetical protein [Gordonia sihwensis]|uniref:hypothetical protein n=1 Tax=Gordonia sihwensis TaxID=173559 RepID=UPI0005EFA8E3|nr:hypothetical protein [Gordonia sihwensis]KJR10487.1 hypothetical protein UG54_00345 [Gordonia sihwensis]
MDDSHRYAEMLRIVTDVEALPASQQMQFVEISQQTSRARTAAERALSRWQSATEWSQQSLIARFPLAGGYLEEITAAQRPTALPFVARTAVVDALQCILISGLTPLPPAGIVEIMCEPVADLLYEGRIGAAARD